MQRATLIAGVTLLLLVKVAFADGEPRMSVSAMFADKVLIGKVVEVEKQTVESRPSPNNSESEVVSYRIVVVRVSETIQGAGGTTQVRVGFTDEESAAPAEGQEGIFFLDPHFSGDFYMVTRRGHLFHPKTDSKYDENLAEVRKVAKVYDDPVSMLTSKNKDDRLFAAKALIFRYNHPRWSADGKRWPKEDVPEKENKALLLAVAELPWLPADGDRSKPCLAENIYMCIEPKLFELKVPSPERVAADKRPSPLDRLIEDDFSKYLRENVDKIRLKRFAPPSTR